jgi:hypothetical protein
MGFLGGLIGSEVVVPAIGAVGNVMDKLFTSDDERLTHEEIKMRLLQKPDLAQIELNKVEAGHRSIFVAGWRPFIGWVCGFALGYHFIIHGFLSWGLKLYDPALEAPPVLDFAPLMTVVLSLLGLGGIRTLEKIKGKAK